MWKLGVPLALLLGLPWTASAAPDPSTLNIKGMPDSGRILNELEPERRITPQQAKPEIDTKIPAVQQDSKELAARIDRNKKKDDLFPFLQFEAKCADDLRTQIQTIVDALTKSTVQTQAEVQTLEEESDDSDIEVVGMDIKPKTPTRSVKRPYSCASDVRAVPLPKKAPRVLTNAIPSVSPFPQFQPDYYTQLTPVFHPIYLMPQLIQPPVILSPLCPVPERCMPVAPTHTLSPCKVFPICGVVTTPAQRIGTPFTPRPTSVMIGGFSSLPARKSFLVCSTNTPNSTLRRFPPFGNEAAAPCAATASECSSFLLFSRITCFSTGSPPE